MPKKSSAVCLCNIPTKIRDNYYAYLAGLKANCRWCKFKNLLKKKSEKRKISLLLSEFRNNTWKQADAELDVADEISSPFLDTAPLQYIPKVTFFQSC